MAGPRTRVRRTAMLASSVLLLSLLFAACGGDSSAGNATKADRSNGNAGRQASGDYPPDSTGACPEKTSERTQATVMNFVPEGVRLEATSVNCVKWSGTGNPASAWPDVLIGAGEVRTSRLEASGYIPRPWNMVFMTNALGLVAPVYGQVGFENSHLNRYYVQTTSGQRVGWRSDGTEVSPPSDGYSCLLAPLTNISVSFPNTSISDIQKLSANSDTNVGLIVRNGYINVATRCAPPGQQVYSH